MISKDNALIVEVQELVSLKTVDEKTFKIGKLLTEQSEARIFEIITYAILKSYYKTTEVYIGFSLDSLEKHPLNLHKTGRTNANDGGIDFVMRPLGRFFSSD